MGGSCCGSNKRTLKSPVILRPAPMYTWSPVAAYKIRIDGADSLLDNGTKTYLRIMYMSGSAGGEFLPANDTKGRECRAPVLPCTQKSNISESSSLDLPAYNFECSVLEAPAMQEVLMLVQCSAHDQTCLAACPLRVSEASERAVRLSLTKIEDGVWMENAECSRVSVNIEKLKPESVCQAGSFNVVVSRAWGLPRGGAILFNDPYVVVEVLDKTDKVIARTQTPSTGGHCRYPVWNCVLTIPGDVLDNVLCIVPPENWDIGSLDVKFAIWGRGRALKARVAGECRIAFRDLLSKANRTLLMQNPKDNNALLDSQLPYPPCELGVSFIEGGLIDSWPTPGVKEKMNAKGYPKHVFMMTRGTRGDVQPFVALARGLAERLGWLITICTEIKWKSFVLGNADIQKGKIQFRPSGGDTEAKMDLAVSQWATNSKAEALQMAILAFSEAEFMPSAPVFLDHVLKFERDSRVDLIVFGLTVAGSALLVAEYLMKPLVGFILQPSIIPSDDKEWKAVQDVVSSRVPVISKINEKLFTSHKALQALRDIVENTPVSGRLRLSRLRRELGLRTQSTWQTMKRYGVPMVIPMMEDTFPRPSDWWNEINFTDFIFLRKGQQGGGNLPEPLKSFVERARQTDAKIGLMTVSSMPIKRELMLSCCSKMLAASPKARLIFVGKRAPNVKPDLEAQAVALSEAGKFLEVERADFGLVFRDMDFFIVHGGLGTTCEALRMRKPTCVTGPLLLDQRFWGDVCYRKGVGPEPVHIDDFESICADFALGAIADDDPKGWQKAARELDFGNQDEDGLAANVQFFADAFGEGEAGSKQHLGRMLRKTLANMEDVAYEDSDSEDVEDVEEGQRFVIAQGHDGLVNDFDESADEAEVAEVAEAAEDASETMRGDRLVYKIPLEPPRSF